MNSSLKSGKRWFLAFCLATLFLLISMNSFQLSWLAQPEKSLIQKSAKIKKYVYGHLFKDEFYSNRFIEKIFLFIDTSQDYDLAEVPAEDSINESTPITNRLQLSRLFNWLSEDSIKKPYQYVICDITFTEKGINRADDDSLRKSIIKLLKAKNPRIIFAGEYDEKNQFSKSIFDELNNSAITGNTNYASKEEVDFLDYTLATNELKVKSLPLLLYEKTHKTQATDGRLLKVEDLEGAMGLLQLNGTTLVWNNFVPEMIFSNDDIKNLTSFEATNDTNYKNIAKMRLGRAVDSNCFLLDQFCAKEKNRIIFIGAFGEGHTDKHETLYGQTDGGVILINIYHSLLDQHGYLNIMFFIILFVLFFLIAADIVFPEFLERFLTLISYAVFFLWIPKLILDGLSTISPLFKKPAEDFAHWVKEERHYFVLIIVTLIANLWFDKVINIMVLLLVVFIVHKVFKYIALNTATDH